MEILKLLHLEFLNLQIDDLFLINEVVEIDKPYYDEFLANNNESLLDQMRLHEIPETIIEQVAQILKIKI